MVAERMMVPSDALETQPSGFSSFEQFVAAPWCREGAWSRENVSKTLQALRCDPFAAPLLLAHDFTADQGIASQRPYSHMCETQSKAGVRGSKPENKIRYHVI